jgi:hypothetical protein
MPDDERYPRLAWTDETALTDVPHRSGARISGVPRFVGYGRVTRVVGLVIEAVGIDVGSASSAG